ncbi:unnamed protein product [Closterium sp. NIES-65]|nr:unnamed protein product [Closterium sp. NIES-65]
MGNPTHLTYGSLIPPTTNPLRVAQPSTSLARPTPSPLFPPSAVIAPSSPADPTAASASQPPRRRDTPSLPPPTPFFFSAAAPSLAPPAHPAATPRRRLLLPLPRPPVAVSLPPLHLLRRRPRIPPPQHPVVACPSRCRDVASPPPPTAAAPSSAPPAHPVVATPRRRLPSRRRDFASPPVLPIAATSRRRLRIPLPRPSRRRLHDPPPRLRVAACTTRRRDFASPPEPPRVHPPSPLMATTPPPLPPPIDASSVDKLQLAADRSAINWHSFVGSIRRVLQDAFVGPYCVIDVLLRRPQALQPTAPNHPGEPPPPPIPPGPPPTEPTLEIATTLALQDAADAAFLHDRREYLIRKAEHEVAVHNHDFAVAERANRLALLDEYNTAMADYLPRSIAWATADNRACTVLLGALPGTLMRRFQAREMRASLTWAELQAMFERRDISSVGALFQEYFSITLATCDGAVDYVGRMQVVADRLAARQAALPEPLQIHRLLYNLTPDYESRLHAFTEANPMASLDDVVQWIIDTEVKLRTPVVNLTTPQSSSSTSLNATQPRNQGGRSGGGGGRGTGSGGGGGGRGGGGGGSGGRGGHGAGGGGAGSAPAGGLSGSGGAVTRGGRPGTLPPCTYVRRHGPHAGTPCGQTNHPPTTCFKALDDAWFDRGNTGTPPRWNSIAPRPSLVDIQTLPSFLPAHLRMCSRHIW